MGEEGCPKYRGKLLRLLEIHGVPCIAVALAHFSMEVLHMEVNKCHAFAL
jgi:hypothetical protein